MNELPNKPSELIRLALKDLKKVEADPAYEVNMGVFFFRGMDVCQVCLAGAVMVGTLGSSIGRDGWAFPTDYPPHIRRKLYALDFFRTGEIQNGLDRMGLNKITVNRSLRKMPKYKDSPEAFHKAMEELADELEKLGV